MSRDFFDELVCPSCRKVTSFAGDGELEIDRVEAGRVPVVARRYRCQNRKCLRLILVLERGGSPTMLLYPSAPGARALDSEVPARIRDAFAEASKCQAIDAMRAAVAMYRMALELICDEKGIPRTGNNTDGKAYSRLVHRVGDLEAHGLPADLATDLHEVRLVGNDSVHEGIAFSVDELNDIAGMVEEAVQILWVQPALRVAMKAAREARREAFKAAGDASPTSSRP